MKLSQKIFYILLPLVGGSIIGLIINNYIDYDYLLLSSISTSNVISIDFSKFEKDECQIVISFGCEKILFQSNKSLAEIQTGNPAYNMISSSEQQVFNSLYNLIQSCIVESLKC